MKNLLPSIRHLQRLLKSLAFAALSLIPISSLWGQQSITSNSAVTQNFNGMGSSGTATMPTGFRAGNGNATDWVTGVTATTLAYGTSGTGIVIGTSPGGIINWANGVTASSTDRAVGVLTTTSFTSPRSFIYAFTNNTGTTVTSLQLAWNYEKFRSGSRAFDWTFFHGSSSSPATSATAGNQSYAADANNTAVSNPPTSIAKAFTINGLNIANGATYYLRWTLTGVAGSTNGQGLGIDDFSITALPSSAPEAPVITAITPGNAQLSVSFTEGYNGGSAITNMQYSIDDGASFVTPDPVVTTSPLLITGLTNGTSYPVKLRAINTNGTGAESATVSGSPRTVPTAPVITTITPGDKFLSIAFTAPVSDGASPITNYKYSIDDGTSFFALTPASTSSPLVITGLQNGTAYSVKLLAVNAAGDGVASDAVIGTPVLPTEPTITVSGSLSALSTIYGTASTSASFVVYGSALSADLALTAPAGYQISTSESSGYAPSVTISPVDESVAETTIFVRLAATTAAGSYSGNIAVTSTGATPKSMATVSSSVSPKPITVVGLSAQNKEYDATSDATVTGDPAFSGLVNGEEFTPTGSVTWAFANKTVANGKSLVRTGTYATPSGNYSLTQPEFTANITAKTLTVTGAVAESRAFNGTTNATISGATLAGDFEEDDVTLTNAVSGTFAQANAGENLTVSTSMGLSGVDSVNYSLTQPALTATITKAEQTITFALLPGRSTADAPFSLTATSSSGLPISYASSVPTVATVSGVILTPVGQGTTTITSSQAGNDNYFAATPVDRIQVIAALVYTEGLNNTVTYGTRTGGSFYSGSSGSGDRPSSSSFAQQGSHSFGVSEASASFTSDTIDSSLGNSMSLRFRLAAFSVGSGSNGMEVGDTVQVQISIDNGTSWRNTLQVNGATNACWSFAGGTATAITAYDGDNTPVTFAPAAGGLRTSDGYSTVSVTGLPQSTTLKYRIVMTNSDQNERWLIDNIEFYGLMPLVQAPTTNPVAFSTTYGTPSTAQTFAVSGSSLEGNLIATAPTGFEVSADGETYGATAEFVPTSGVASGTLSLRLSATANVGTYNSRMISISSVGAVSQKLITTASGNTVTAAPLPPLTFTDSFVTGSGGVASFSYAYVGRNGTTYISSSAPALPGFYTVTATSTDPNFTGSQQNDYFVIGPIGRNDNVTKSINNSATQYTVASLLANDTRIDETGNVVSTGLSITDVQSGAENTATLSGSNVLFTPSASTPESFTYTLSDGIKTTTVTVTVTASGGEVSLSLKLTSVGTPVFASGNTTVIHGFIGEPNQSVLIEYSTNLQTWTSVGNHSTSASGAFNVLFSQVGDQTNAWKTMFFRASVAQP